MAKITKILHNGLYILPETVTDAVLDNKMERTLTEVLDDKLSSTTEDTAEKKITFKEGLRADGDGVTATKITANKGDIKQVTADKITSENIESADYNSGLSGYKLGNVGGYSYLDIDKLSVRKKAIFAELDIKRIDHIGGANVTSPASCRIARVEPYYPSTTMTTAEGEELSAADGDYNVLAATPVGYKCYFQAEQDGQTINNDWRIGDQALCHAYNLATPRYYWRLVIGKSTAIEDGYHWVALSITDCDADSDEPMADDTIVCFGNRTDTDRQAVILMNSEGATSPCLQQLKGINSYVIADANIVTQLSPTKNIIRGEQIELSSSSGDYKGVEQLANEALASAKGYTDTKATDAKTYADGVLSSAKSYADSVGTSTLGSAKTYADGKVSSAVNTAKNYIDGKASSTLADAKNYTQEREVYLQTQITANDEEIALRATKVDVQTVSDNVEVLARRVTSAEASIEVNADGITALANKTEADITALGIRISSAETNITQNADAIKLKASNDDLTAVSNAVGGLETRMTAAESSLTVQADKISSVVSKQSAMVDDYDHSDFTTCGWLSGVWITNADGNNIGSPIGYEKDTPCLLLVITDVKKGDVIRVVPNHKKDEYAVVAVVGSDGDYQGAEGDAYDQIGSDVSNYTWYGRSLTLSYSYDIEVGGSIEFAVPVDCPEFHVWLSDDWSDRSNVKVSHIKAKMSAQSRIDQTADNIRLQVGEAGINLDTKVITLDASKTIVTGDLAVRTVKTYWDDAQTQLKSAFNGSGDGTIVYYYPNGKVMRQDAFVTDSNGNAVGMRTTYYNADGSVSWVLDNSGLKTTLSDYWEALNGAQPMAYTTSYDTMMTTCKQWLDQAMQHFDKSTFSRFVSQSGNYKNYNGKVAKGLKSSEAPTAVTLFAGVLVYSVELYKDGLLPTYIVTYELVTTAQNQVGAIMTQKFDISGEVN